jgi:hypothetical protein
MKSALTRATVLGSILASGLSAQSGVRMGGVAGTRHAGNVVVPGVSNAVPLLGPTSPRFSGRHHRARFNSPFWGYSYFDPFYGGDYPGYSNEAYQIAPTPAVVVVMPQVQLPPPPPPPPARPEFREYNWPSANSDSGASAFSIVTKDGADHPAIAVWVQDGFLHYTAPDGAAGRLPIDSIDREATWRRNRDKHLKLPLPA